MSQQAQLGQERFSGGYTLIEVTAAVAIITIVFSMVMGGYKTRINKARIEQTVNEMMSIAQASLDFYNSQGNWPVNPIDLASSYMYSALISSPFGDKYQISNLNGAVTVSTTVPSGLAKNYYQGTLLEISPGAPKDTIAVTQRLPNEFSGRMEYEKKYTYQQ
jgi:prepilin-type N-terminal cleavage/methylation domain-containing protein